MDRYIIALLYYVNRMMLIRGVDFQQFYSFSFNFIASKLKSLQVWKRFS